MALVKSTIFSEIRGSINGSVFARNRGGQYARSRGVPVQPGGQFQQAIRQAVATLSTRWRDTLTDAQRAAWDAYAEATPLPNSLGDPRNVGGLGMYVRGNVPRIQGGQTIIDDGPAFGLPTIGDVSITSVLGATVSMSFDPGEAWVEEDDAFLLVYLSRAVSPAVNFFKGPYRLAGVVAGDAATPPTSPADVTWPFGQSLPSGARLFSRAVVADSQGRLSSDAVSVFTLP